MVTIGVDLSSQPKGTAACCMRWDGASAHVTCLERGLTDQNLQDLWAGHKPRKMAIDAPFGWPVDFVRSVRDWTNSGVWRCVEIPRLRLRKTDRVVKRETGITPLSVSADKIGRLAMRAAKLLAEATDADKDPVDRSGRGRFVEVYPAAALKAWGLPYRGYKGPGPEKRRKRCQILAEIARRLPCLGIEDGQETTVSAPVKSVTWPSRHEIKRACLESDDKLDALVAALVARAAAIGCWLPIPPQDIELASMEGWIALPQPDSLDKLVHDTPSA